MSLFDSQAVKLHKQLESVGGDPRVLVAASINPKIVGGNYLNLTSHSPPFNYSQYIYIIFIL